MAMQSEMVMLSEMAMQSQTLCLVSKCWLSFKLVNLRSS